MMKIQYLHYGMEGTRYLNCDIKEVKNGRYLIEYRDDFVLHEEWVLKSSLVFPKFSDLII